MADKKKICKICQIIPTRDRPRQMRRLLESARSQSRRFDQIVIVDGGADYPIKDLVEEYPDLPITYVTQNPPGLAIQRKAGLEAVNPEITLAGFLDDDVELEPGCVEAMYNFWETAGPEVGGVEYNITNGIDIEDKGRFPTWVHKIFMLHQSGGKGSILKSGVGVMPYPAESTKEIKWLSGGVNIYRREVFEKHKIDDWYMGWGVGDDLEFSYRVSKNYKLFIASEAKIKHLPLPVKPGNGYLAGKMLTINHFYFVRKNPEFSLLFCAWANLGQVFTQFVKGIVSLHPNSFQRSTGHLVGIYEGLTGTLKPMGVVVK